MLECYLVDKIKFKDRNEDMDVVNIAVFTGGVFAVPEKYPLRGNIGKANIGKFIFKYYPQKWGLLSFTVFAEFFWKK